MKWQIRPATLSGTIAIPPSKSHTIRALLIASLANGTSTIKKPLFRGDGASAISAAASLGAQVSTSEDSVTIRGIGSDFNLGEDFFDMGNSGTGTNLFAAAAALGSRMRRFDGDSSLRSRPFRQLLEALQSLGAVYTTDSPDHDLPFTIQGPLQRGTTRVNGVSSQFVSSLLLSCPLIRGGDTTISVYNLHEKPYVELTVWWLKKQCITYEAASDFTSFHIPGGQCYTPFTMTVPADFSSATFAAVGSALCGSSVTLTGLDFSDPQGDKDVFEVLKKAGTPINQHTAGVTVSGNRVLQGNVIDLNSMPDALPALAVLACKSEGETRFINVQQARIKETDRIAVMQQELTKMGAQIEETSDGLIVRQSRLRGTVVHGHHDHRVVMALALAGMIAEGETVIETAEAAEVTYPDFVTDFQALGAHIDIVH